MHSVAILAILIEEVYLDNILSLDAKLRSRDHHMVISEQILTSCLFLVNQEIVDHDSAEVWEDVMGWSFFNREIYGDCTGVPVTTR